MTLSACIRQWTMRYVLRPYVYINQLVYILDAAEGLYSIIHPCDCICFVLCDAL